MKQIKLYLAILLLTVGTANVYAQHLSDIKVDRIWYEILSEPKDGMPGEVEVTANRGDGINDFTEEYIPDEITYDGKTYHVVSFGDVYRTRLSQLRLGKYIRNIANDYYFYNEYFVISEENETFKSIHGLVFSKDGKKLIVCPKKLTFNWNEFPSDVKRWSIPDSVEVIGKGAFFDCVLNKQYPVTFYVTFPSELKIIEDRAFYSSDPTWAGATDKFGTYVITFPTKLESIGVRAFSYLGLKKVEFNEGLIEIGKEAFMFNDLEDVTLPSTLKKIGDNVFEYTPIKTITCLASEPPTAEEIEGWEVPKYSITGKEANQILVVPVGKVDLYKEAPGWNLFGKIVEIGTDAINDANSGSNSISASYDNSILTIKGVKRGERIQIYTTAGILIKSIKADGETVSISLPQSNQIVIIKTENHILKTKI